MNDSYSIHIYNVRNGNYVDGSYTSGTSIRFCVDAGTLNKLPDMDKNAPKTDIFFLTHWHEDHFSLFTLPGSSFSMMVYYYPPSLQFSHNLSGRIQRLFAKKADNNAAGFNLDKNASSYGRCPDNGSFLFFSKNIHTSNSSINDVSVTYYIAHDPRGQRNISILSGTQKDTFTSTEKTGLGYAPLLVFPGDAKETKVRYLSKYCVNNSMSVPLYLASHHGSAANVHAAFHGGHPFDGFTRYFISGERHAKGSSSPYTVYAGCPAKSQFYFMSDLPVWSFCKIDLN